jgi:hypothetical protein
MTDLEGRDYSLQHAMECYTVHAVASCLYIICTRRTQRTAAAAASTRGRSYGHTCLVLLAIHLRTTFAQFPALVVSLVWLNNYLHAATVPVTSSEYDQIPFDRWHILYNRGVKDYHGCEFNLRNLHEPLPKRYLKLPKLIRKAKWKVNKGWPKVIITIITTSAKIK